VTCGEVCGEESGGTTDDPPGKIPAGHENLSAADVAALLTSWNGKDLKVLDGDDPVYNIEPNAFRNTFGTKNDIRAINFNFVTNVGDAAFKDAFAGCTNLQSVSFTNLRVVSSAAFENAFKGARVDLRLPKLAGTARTASYDDETKGCGFAGAGIRRFQADVFGGSGGGLLMGCTGLEEAVFPKLAMVGHYMFYGCTSLTNVVIPKATSVQREAFADCTSLKTLTFAGTDFNDYALEGSGIETIYMPNKTNAPSPSRVFMWYYGGGGPSRVTVNYANGSTVYDPNVKTNIAQTATAPPRERALPAGRRLRWRGGGHPPPPRPFSPRQEDTGNETPGKAGGLFVAPGPQRGFLCGRSRGGSHRLWHTASRPY